MCFSLPTSSFIHRLSFYNIYNIIIIIIHCMDRSDPDIYYALQDVFVCRSTGLKYGVCVHTSVGQFVSLSYV